MPSSFDFEGLSGQLLNRINTLLTSWLPGGRLQGKEYCCADLCGGQGDSLKVNIDTGLWADFATDDKGSDLISLYAAINHKSQGEAYRELEEQFRPKSTAVIIVPPVDTPPPTMRHPKHGNATSSWVYRDEAARPIFYVARYDTPLTKEFTPWTWDGRRWQAKGWLAPRPLYNLHKLAARPTAPVLVVEGEKCVDAAERLTRDAYVVTTWPNGAKAVKKSQWEFLKGRNVLIWPDNDEPGKHAADDILKILTPICKEVKTLDVSGQPDGWDAADALAGGWAWDGFKDWAKSRVVKVEVTIDEPKTNVDSAAYASWETLGLTLTTTGNPIINMDNVVKIMDGIPDLKNLVWIDTFYKRIFTKWQCNDARAWTDADTLKMCHKIQHDFSVARMSKETVLDAIKVIAANNEKNEPHDWMESLVWDGIPRVDMFLYNYMGVEANEYTIATSRNFWIGIAARIYWPGCQLDNMLVLKGKQGIYKSSALRVIGGRWYSAAGDNVLSKDFYEILQGKLIIEIAEMAAFHRAELVNIKRVVSNPTDRYRVSYGHLAEDHPRQCVFVGTTNEDKPLHDTTGGRRFWPLKTEQIKIDEIAKDRSQFFAEAVHLYKEGFKWYEMPAMTEQVQEDNRQEDEWEEILDELLFNFDETSIKDSAKRLGIATEKLDKFSQMRIGKCLKIIGFERSTFRKNGKLVKHWVRQKNVVETPKTDDLPTLANSGDFSEKMLPPQEGEW